MQLLRDVAQQARFAAMQPGQISQHYREQDADLQAFESAVEAATRVRHHRARKAHIAQGQDCSTTQTANYFEARARRWEREVREIALQSEIILQRRAEAADADRAMLGILMGVAS